MHEMVCLLLACHRSRAPTQEEILPPSSRGHPCLEFDVQVRRDMVQLFELFEDRVHVVWGIDEGMMYATSRVVAHRVVYAHVCPIAGVQ